MPELPEVETIRRSLKKYIVGKTIEDIEIRLPKIFQGDQKDISGAEFVNVRRYGKGLVLDLSNEYSLAVHVKMTGQFVYQGQETLRNFHPKLGIVGELPNKWTHVVFKLKSQNAPQGHYLLRSVAQSKNGGVSFLYYNDIRQFGWLKIVKTPKVHDLPFFKGLGPEPFADLTLPIFEKIVSSSVMPIKPLLMDQKKISGVGNIYANDALYLAKIDPRRSAKSLTETEIHTLYQAVLEVLQKGIDYGGASETNYITVEGGKGGYQDHFLVYGKTGETCPRDGTMIQRIVQGGRSTFLCPFCQT